MNGLFCGNSCNWALVILVIWLLSQGGNGSCSCGCGNTGRACGGCNSCGCGSDYEPAYNGCACR